MSMFGSFVETTDKASDIGERYVKTSYQYLRLKIFQQLTISISLFAKIIVIGSLLFLSFLFLAFAVAIVIGNALDNEALGYLIVGIVFSIIAAIIYILREAISKKVISTIGEKYFDEETPPTTII